MNYVDLQERVIEQSYFNDLRLKVSKNYKIAEFYEDLGTQYDEPSIGLTPYRNKADMINSCLKFWDVDYYRLQQVKDIKRINLCRDKFCLNCQCMLASKRQLKYEPLLQAFEKDYTVCHCVFTVPNPYADELLPTLQKMYNRFSRLTKFLSGNKKVKGVNFLKYGFAGGIRALEITYNKKKRTYHPHFHAMLLFRKDLDLTKRFKNRYSFDGRTEIRRFSEVELLLQKVWYLLMNDVKVTYEAIDTLKEGYSVVVNSAEGHYHEVFKYSCKGAFDNVDGGFLYSEEVFIPLYFALHNRRMLQTYGVLRGLVDENSELLETEVEDYYQKCIAKLRELELPFFMIDDLFSICKEKNVKYISKTNFKRLLIKRQKGENEEK